VSSTCSGNRPLEVVDENLLEAFPRVDGVVGKALQLGQQHRLQSHQEVDDFGGVRALCHLDGGGLASKPLLRCLLTVVFGDADRLEAFWVLVAGKARSECRETITAISIISLSCFTLPLPRVDDGPDITPLIDCHTRFIKNINRAIIYTPGSSHAYIQQIIKISQHMSRIKAYKL
jgi:hypothetical protein